MPIIPTYQSGQVDIKTVPGTRFSPSATAASFGGGAAALAGEVGESLNTISRALIKQKVKLEKAETRDALTQAQAASDLYLFGDGTEQNKGLYNLKGQDASTAYIDSVDTFTGIGQDYSERLTNKRSKDVFNVLYNDYKAKNLRSVVQYQSKQVDVYNIQTLDAENAWFVDNAIGNRNTPEIIEEAEFGIVANVVTKMKGFEGAKTEQVVKSEVGNLYKSVLDAVSSDSPEAALNFFSAHQDKFEPAIRSKLKADLEIKAKDATARNNAIRLSSSGISIEDQLIEVDKIEDVKIADNTRRRVRARDAEKNAISERQQALTVDAVYNEIRKNPTFPIPYDDFNKDQITFLENIKNKRLSGFASNTNWKIMGELSVKSNKELKAMSYTEVEGYRKYLKEKEWNEIYKRYADLKNGSDKGISSYLTSVRTANQMVKGVMDELKIKDKKDKERFYRKVQEDLYDFETNEGRKSTTLEKQKIIDNLVIAGEVRGGFLYDPDKLLFEVEEGEEFFAPSIEKAEKTRQLLASSVGDVPEKDVKQIKNVLEKQGKIFIGEKGEANIIQLYNRHIINLSLGR